MRPFSFHNPTKLIFGRGQLETLPQELEKYGKRVLLVYGGGSIKRNGLYEQILSLLKNQFILFELPGIEPNPRLSSVHKGVELCRKEKIDVLLAVGGGSVIDATKAIAVGAKYDGDVWDIITRKDKARDALPLGTVLTLAATGSEMNSSSVITNWETKEKYGWGSPLIYPKFSILDPEFTKTVPRDQTVYGIVDMMSHVFEQYFHHTPNTPLQDRMGEGVLRTIIETAPLLLEDLSNDKYRETILYSGTIALNGMLSMGVEGDWATHNLEHAVSAVYDIPHGGGLAILFPQWMRFVIDENPARFRQFAVRVFHVEEKGRTDKEIGLEGISRLEEFWKSIGAPSRLSDYKIDDSKLELMVEKAMARGKYGRFKVLGEEETRAIYRMAL
ncbi:MAG: iron-containing alcohol dehydrogenase [Thermicanus sp.]|nr:iron-containing alcohol dehydrogenase [Thermicanus sp.]